MLFTLLRFTQVDLEAIPTTSFRSTSAIFIPARRLRGSIARPLWITNEHSDHVVPRMLLALNVGRAEAAVKNKDRQMEKMHGRETGRVETPVNSIPQSGISVF